MPQGTVKSFDHETHESVLLTDDLVEHKVPAEAFDAAPLLELRIGQRVRFEFVGGGEGGEEDDVVGQLGIVSL